MKKKLFLFISLLLKHMSEHFERLNNYPTHVPPTKVCDINNNNISSGKSVNNASFTRGPSFNYDIEQFQCSVENASMSRITPFLYLGNELDAKNVCKLAKEGIFYILNVSREIPFYGDLLPASSASTPSSRNQFVLKRIAVNDSSNQNLLAHFEEAIEFIGICSQFAHTKMSCHFINIFCKLAKQTRQ